MNASSIKILKTVLSWFQDHEKMAYEQALFKMAAIIISGDAKNNPLFALLISAELPADPKQLHDLLRPRSIYG